MAQGRRLLANCQRRGAVVAACLALLCGSSGHLIAQEPVDERIATDGSIRLDGVEVPLSSFTSPEGREYLRHLILDKPFGTPLRDIEAERARQDAIMQGFLAPMLERYPVVVSEQRIGGVTVDVVEPAAGIAPENADKVLINLHGGGFVTGARSASLVEAVPLAALMRIKVISVDYRMAPEFRFPAASEDVAAVYRELLQIYEPGHIGIYGCSAGGLLTAQAIAWFQAHSLPNPAALGVFCASLSGYFGGESTVLSGPLTGNLPSLTQEASSSPAGEPVPGYLDAAEADDPLAYPLASPALVAKFPPTLFISGTRSFEFSSALNSHNQMAKAGVESRFHGWEGMFHGFIYNSELPEAREAYQIMTDFFQTHLAD